MVLTEAELESAILEELRRNTVLTLAAMGVAGPHAVSLFYAHDNFDIYWLSDPKTRHSQNVASSPSTAVTIAAQQTDYRKIRGLQMEGETRRLGDASEATAGFDLLMDRYPFLKQFAVGKLARHLGAAAVYSFRPAKITLIDNARGFGFKQTLEPREISND
jgi:uncharacterized protein YhbP (UPF0306 family)